MLGSAMTSSCAMSTRRSTITKQIASFCAKLYKNHVEKSDEFDALLEEQSLYWNDDKEIMDSALTSNQTFPT